MKLIQLFSVAYFKANNGTKILFKNQISIISCITLNSNSKLPQHNIFLFPDVESHLLVSLSSKLNPQYSVPNFGS